MLHELLGPNTTGAAASWALIRSGPVLCPIKWSVTSSRLRPSDIAGLHPGLYASLADIRCDIEMSDEKARSSQAACGVVDKALSAVFVK